MVVVNMTKDKVWVRNAAVPSYLNMAPPQFDISQQGGLDGSQRCEDVAALLNVNCRMLYKALIARLILCSEGQTYGY